MIMIMLLLLIVIVRIDSFVLTPELRTAHELLFAGTCRSAIELIFCGGFNCKFVQQIANPSTEFNCFLINIEFLVIKISLHASNEQEHEQELLLAE